jgi:integral membrane protein (TIGR01906 family)
LVYVRWVLGYLAALCVLVFILALSIQWPTFYRPFYVRQYEKHNVSAVIRVDEDTLMAATDHLLDYMRGRRADLHFTAMVNGQEREYFSQREKDHMVDVMELFDLLFRVRNIAVWLFLFLVSCMALFKYNIKYLLARCGREVMTGFVILAALLVMVISVNFDRAFTIFHLIFFDNDLWILDPAVDLLINMVPLGFFIDISIFIVLLLVGLSLAVVGLATWYLRKIAYLSQR